MPIQFHYIQDRKYWRTITTFLRPQYEIFLENTFHLNTPPIMPPSTQRQSQRRSILSTKASSNSEQVPPKKRPQKYAKVHISNKKKTRLTILLLRTTLTSPNCLVNRWKMSLMLYTCYLNTACLVQSRYSMTLTSSNLGNSRTIYSHSKLSASLTRQHRRQKLSSNGSLDKQLSLLKAYPLNGTDFLWIFKFVGV